MITPTEIKQKAERLYLSFLRAWLRQEPFFPQEIPFGKVRPSDDYVQTKAAVERLIKGSKAHLGYGYTVELSRQNTQRYGPQSLPSRIAFENETDYLQFLNKEHEVTAFRRDVALIRTTIPRLDAWLNPAKVIDYAGQWADLLQICLYFQNHPRPNLYIRELPILVHTKFVEGHKGILRELLDTVLPATAIQPTESDFEKRFGLRYKEPLIRLRVLDESLLARYCLPTSDFSAPVSQFTRLNLAGHRFIITENEMNFLTLPAFAGSFALWGGGFRVEILKQIDWLADCPLFYWGDLDAQGFMILAQLRSCFPQTVSVMMDAATFDAFNDFSVPGTACRVDNLPQLTPAEYDLFTHLVQHTLRLEQERISQPYALDRLAEID